MKCYFNNHIGNLITSEKLGGEKTLKLMKNCKSPGEDNINLATQVVTRTLQN